MDIPQLMDKLEESVTIEIEAQRALGMHLIEYAERKDLTHQELRDMLRMIGF